MEEGKVENNIQKLIIGKYYVIKKMSFDIIIIFKNVIE